MESRRLGANGPLLSEIGLGCNNFGMRIDADETAAVVNAALDAGITHFDTAEMYGNGVSEQYLGAALGSRRDEVVIATKFLPRPEDQPYTPGVVAARIRESAEGSLRRLGTDYIDVYYEHYPDADAPIEETLGALDELVRSGKVRHLANSNNGAEQLTAADATAKSLGSAAFVGTQLEWNLLSRGVEEATVPAARTLGLGVVPFYPLASGLLTGKYVRGESYPSGSRFAAVSFFAAIATEANFDKVEAYAKYAADHGRTIGELAISWLLGHPAVTSVIAGATRPDQIAANITASEWVMTDEMVAEIAAL